MSHVPYWKRRHPKRKRGARAEAAALAAAESGNYISSQSPGQPELTPPASGSQETSTTQAQGCEGRGGQPETALFQSHHELGPDVHMVRRAANQRWPVDRAMAETVLRSAADKAMEEHASISQKILVVKMFADLDGRNQAEEHHQDRMEYYRRVQQHREIKDSGPMPMMGVGVKIGSENPGSDVSVLVYLPDNKRDPEGTMVGMPDFEDAP